MSSQEYPRRIDPYTVRTLRPSSNCRGMPGRLKRAASLASSRVARGDVSHGTRTRGRRADLRRVGR